ncbi:MAG: glycosyltransferase family 9 protein [Candidatus Woesearchaeota archaeon]
MSVKLFRWIDRIVGIILIIPIWLFSLPFPKARLEPRRILVIKLWAMGDSIVLLPAIRELRKKHPKARIDVLCKNSIRNVFLGIKDINEVKSGDFLGLLALLPKLRKYDVAVDTEPYLNISALLGWWLGKRRVGFSHGIRRLLYTDRVAFNDEQHMVKTYIDLMGPLGVTRIPDKLVPLSVSADDRKKADKFLRERGIMQKDKFVVLCPAAGASSRGRMWAPERFAAAGDALVKEFLVKIVLLCGRSDRKVVESVAQKMKHPPVADAYELNLKQQAAVLSRAALTISNDSGPMHLSAAMGTKTIGLFCPNTPIRWAPYGAGNDYIYKPVLPKPCINTHLGKLPDCASHNHMSNITVDDVLQKARRMLHAGRY